MNKKSGIKLENFIVATTAATVCFFISFLRSWTVPITSVHRARQEHRKKGTPFLDAYANAYNESILKISQKPQYAYQKYYSMIDMLRKKYKGNGK